MDGSGIPALADENITETEPAIHWSGQPVRTPWPCGFVVADGADGVRFCDVPAAGGSSYCAAHHALCSIAPDTPEGHALAAELAAEAERPPLPGLVSDPVLEFEETEPEEALAALDVPQPGAAEGAA